MMGSTVRFRESAYPNPRPVAKLFAHARIVPPPQPVPSALRGSEISFGTLNFLTSGGFQPDSDRHRQAAEVKGITVGANAEHKIHPPTDHDHSEQVRWIGREPAPHEPFVTPTPTSPVTSDSEGGSRTGGKWIAGAVVAAILALVAWLLWRGQTEDPALVSL